VADLDAQVLVIGAGPVGLLGARLLGNQGIRTIIAEKYPSRLEAPKAHALNPRSLEICAAAGLPMDRIHAAATPRAEGAMVRMVATLATDEIGALPYERQDDAVRDLTPFPLINIEQPRLEAILEETIAGHPHVDLRRSLEWKECRHEQDAVVSTLWDRGNNRSLTLRTRYVIAADGANSDVRRELGITMDGAEVIQHNVMIHVEADLRTIVAQRPAILYFLFGPAAGVFIAYDIARTWVLMHPHDPATSPLDTFTPDRCRAIVEDAVGAPVPGLAIKGIRSWAMSAQVAERYRSGNVFLAGDAAHRFPPTGGLGLNTGLADIDNLAWKIAAVEQGWAGPGLLDSYESERRTVAQVNMSQSLTNAMRMFTLFQALELMPGQTVDAATFAARLADPQRRAGIEAAVAHQADHFDSLRLQLGYAYGGTLKDDDSLPVSRFEPKAVVGARLPHLRLPDGRSTLDLVAAHGITVLTGPDAALWHGRVSKAPMSCVSLDEALAERLGLSPSGALIVRPDGHILFVARTADDIVAATRALETLLQPDQA
jgi:2-polyprenyl-6-methoxyphenol hydroxylase-like FAD-dependent oxidoreductase